MSLKGKALSALVVFFMLMTVTAASALPQGNHPATDSQRGLNPERGNDNFDRFGQDAPVTFTLKELKQLLNRPNLRYTPDGNVKINSQIEKKHDFKRTETVKYTVIGAMKNDKATVRVKHSDKSITVISFNKERGILTAKAELQRGDEAIPTVTNKNERLVFATEKDTLSFRGNQATIKKTPLGTMEKREKTDRFDDEERRK